MDSHGSSKPSSKPSSMITANEVTEHTPLLAQNITTAQQKDEPQWPSSVIYKALFTGFLVSLTFGVTQVPIVYVFGLMTCDEYYKTHSDPGLDDPHRCKVAAIEAGTANAVALMGFSTTFFGVLNLFVTGWSIKVFGIKKALIISTLWPSLRLLVQNVGVFIGAGWGASILQLSQIMTIIGGPAGYMLALNSYATEIVIPVERTAMLGRLMGCAMLGSALGMLVGGLLGDAFNIRTPFQVTLVLFLVSSIYIAIFLPEIPLDKTIEAKASKSFSAFFDPIRMFTPRKWVLKSGKVKREYGILLLGVGSFTGVLATSYIPTLLQMYSTDVFDFGTTENGWLVSIHSSLRGLFLTFAFPAIIRFGRRWMYRKTIMGDAELSPDEQETESIIPTDPEQIAPAADPNSEQEPVLPQGSHHEQDSFTFDIFFTRYSLILDGVLTGVATFLTEGWQLYAIAVILPLASGTGSAAKGVILQMCSPEQKTDALSAISLVEMAARLATTAVFGIIFAVFASMSKLYLIFTVNAGVALIGFIILLFARYVPEGAHLLMEKDQTQSMTEDEGG